MKLKGKLGFSEVNTRWRMTLVANPQACTGCRICETVCSLSKTEDICPEMARIIIDREPFEGRFLPKICHQCSIPFCLNACPVFAITISDETGAVIIDDEKCTGCGLCEKACPYGMIIMGRNDKKAFKCDLCGGEPRCVELCPSNSLGIAYFGGVILK